MTKINLQSKAKAQKGSAEMYWHENEFTGLKKTLFHRFIIPLTTFNSELEYESQPLKTSIFIEFLALNLANPQNLDGLVISSPKYEQLQTSVYIGGAHNPCDVISLKISRKKGNLYTIEGKLFLDFEYEGVAENENFSFKTTIEFVENLG
jgi:hypothetical protein